MIAGTAVQHNERILRDLKLTGELAGVPKPVLRSVFGKHLGRRIWELTRRPGTAAGHTQSTRATGSCGSQPSPIPFPNDTDCRVSMASEVVNAEILRGMLEYLSRRAAETLGQNLRLAERVALTLCFDDGGNQVASARLARPTADAAALYDAVHSLFRTIPAREALPASINLTTRSVAAISEIEMSTDLICAMAATTAS